MDEKYDRGQKRKEYNDMPARSMRKKHASSRAYGRVTSRPTSAFSRYKKGTKYGKKSRGSRRSFKRRNGPYHLGGTRKFNQKVLEVVEGKLTANNVYVTSYADRVTVTNTTGVTAAGIMWAANIAVSGNTAGYGYGANKFQNLQLDDPLILYQMCQTSSATKTTKICRKSCEIECTVTNAETTNVEFWEYRCEARRDMYGGSAGFSPQSLLQNGFGDEVLGTGGIAKVGYTTVGATPYMNPAFVAQYKILKVRKRIIPAGGTFTIRYSYKKPRVWNQERFSPLGSGTVIEVLKGQRISVFQACGTYCVNSTAATGFQQGIGNIDIGLVYKIKYHFSYIVAASGTSGSNPEIAGFSAGQGVAPAPTIIVHPDSVIQSISYAAGVPTSTVTAGARLYENAAPDAVGIPDIEI